MKFSVALIAALTATVIASPVKRAGPTDEEILNYALTLEHLENAFYSGALAKYDEGAFKAAGMPHWARKRFVQIAEHEAAHVAFLAGALGEKATKPCEYSFPYTDVASFAALSMTLEGVGVSAYLGAAKFITNKDYLTAAASVLTTEARHAAWVSAAIQKEAAWSGALDAPLDLSQVYSLAASFIKSCPTTNPALPVKAFPALTIKTKAPKVGSVVEVSIKTGYLVFYNGLTPIAVKLDNGKAMIPEGLAGTVYVVASSAESATDETTTAGPAILYFHL